MKPFVSGRNIWRNAFIGGLIGSFISILLIIFYKEGLIWYGRSDILARGMFPVMWAYNNLFLPLFNLLEFLTKEQVSNQFAVSYLTLLPFYFYLVGFAAAALLTYCIDFLASALFDRSVKKESTTKLGHPLNAILLYVVSLFIVFAAVRRAESYQDSWHYYPYYQWYFRFGIAGFVAIGLSLMVMWKLTRRTSLGAIGLTSLIGYIPIAALCIFLVMPPSQKAICRQNLVLLSSAIINEGLPQQKQWCDQLDQWLTEKAFEKTGSVFRCPCDKRLEHDDKVSSYSLNSRVNADSADDVVLLFEAKAQWNSVGGKEIVDITRHRNGFWVVLNNYEIKFIAGDEVDQLRWE